MSQPWWRYTKACVRGISSKFAEGALKLAEPEEAISLTKAKEQHKNYVAALKGLGLEVIEIAADDKFPDCVYIEDPAVVCDDTALITVPGHVSRRGETKAVRIALEKLGLRIVDMVEPAFMDGGDVLFTGREFFIGITSRTNRESCKFVEKAFPNYPVTAIDMGESGSVLHLKSCLSMAGPELIAIGQSETGEECWNAIVNHGKFKYNKLSVPENIAANVLYINGTLVHQAASFIPKSIGVLQALNCPKLEVDMSELAKADGALTCDSLLIKF
ncbi:N(G),N(G)-dimethylarginine dimethylaminohydrolase 1-like [Dendronephthya gigantea]|uniref:N(G),N(G)-dimethylarginine dimethylaminohydrolase 1-like n=1 Tax=Dendronephthya gigantea TaxID=151771 RepID=UPI00106AE03B|nr:N(G),N(G)-dimethylarginine dimethylaminohydrolase 1-like [Dendronephthya gigantea]